MKINTNTDKNLYFNSKEKIYNAFIKSQENLSSTRFIQDVATNWVPKVVFTRSLADFTEMSFLEYTESALFYFAPGLLGGLFSKVFPLLAPKSLRKNINDNIIKSTENILSDTNLVKTGLGNKVLPIKAAIVLACVSIPAAEYALSFAKNLLTLKVFKKSNFNNVVNSNKQNEQVEDKQQQEKVENSAKIHIKNAAKISGISLLGGFILSVAGHKFKILQEVSKLILRPGKIISKALGIIGIKSEKLDKSLNMYINFDFDTSKGKLGLSKAQLVASTVAGFFGYSEAGKDRGKLDQYEVWTRVPIVVFYTIFGAEAFDYVFKHILHKKNKYTDLVKKGSDGSINIPKHDELLQIAEKIANLKNTHPQIEFNRLLKEKAIITAIPYGFSLLFMGFLLAGITRFWTQYRFNHGNKSK